MTHPVLQRRIASNKQVQKKGEEKMLKQVLQGGSARGVAVGFPDERQRGFRPKNKISVVPVLRPGVYLGQAL
jgi:hypothetical protein